MSSILLEKLEEAFEKISKLSENEKEVEINGQKVIIGLLSGDEEDKVQAYLAKKMEQFGPESFMREAKIETMAYALKALGDQRIDKVDFFSYSDSATGEDQKVEKHIYLRKKLKAWPNFISTYLFNQYALLIDDLSKNLKPELRIEGVEEIIKREAEANSKVLEEAEARLKATREAIEPSSEEPKEEAMTFRQLDSDASEGILDQSGY